ncbi:MAG TPA: MBL fold metallo-hydrolase [Syntrophorhabdaceae bacterium]|nr:MBL fold metallo-hydrolase [Syntrophorhabdaceae bacterium]HQM81795.1 MBL fold metallo-hydrolase [Syntrophorhabdaceae bacterium]
MRPQQITDNIYRVGGPDLSDERDGLAYLLDFGELALIDCGTGLGFKRMVQNIDRLGFDPGEIKTVILSHCHVDHIGAAHLFQSQFGSRLVMHALDAAIVGRADTRLTAAFCFNVDLQPLRVDTKLSGDKGRLFIGGQDLNWIHTPGHTPGSISVYLDNNGNRTLFAQDIAAPLLKEFDCDPDAWMESVQALFALEADMLCDGHSGAYTPKDTVMKYLEYCVASQYQQGYIEL